MKQVKIHLKHKTTEAERLCHEITQYDDLYHFECVLSGAKTQYYTAKIIKHENGFFELFDIFTENTFHINSDAILQYRKVFLLEETYLLYKPRDHKLCHNQKITYVISHGFEVVMCDEHRYTNTPNCNLVLSEKY